MAKKKVLFMIDTLAGGGAEHVLINVLKLIDTEKFDLSLLLFVKEGVYLDQVPKYVKLFSIFKGKQDFSNRFIAFLYRIYYYLMYKLCILWPAFILPNLVKNVKIGEFDCAISFCEGINSFVLLNKSIANKRILWIHIDMLKHKLAFSTCGLNKIVAVTDKIIFVSQDAASAFKKRFTNYENNKIEVVYNPININEIKELADVHIDYSKKIFTIVSIGRLSEQKRFDRLINAIKRLDNEQIHVRLLILGTGPLYSTLKKQIYDLKLQEQIILMGYIKNVYPWLKLADLYVMSSDYEGLPMVICEAMLLQKPIIATNITGTKELLKNGKYGMLVDLTDEAIYKAIKIMYYDENIRFSYIQKLKEESSNFVFSTNTNQIEKLILNI